VLHAHNAQAAVRLAPSTPATRHAQRHTQGLLLEAVVVPAAAAYGLREEYAYLRPSIKAFPSGRQQEALARSAGFSAAAHYELGFGLMGCLVATR
jgi:demethylmenaquinone methyltransferase/2-methoxy-6-polyprenyl-1,4-benzoquinol methylase